MDLLNWHVRLAFLFISQTTVKQRIVLSTAIVGLLFLAVWFVPFLPTLQKHAARDVQGSAALAHDEGTYESSQEKAGAASARRTESDWAPLDPVTHEPRGDGAAGAASSEQNPIYAVLSGHDASEMLYTAVYDSLIDGEFAKSQSVRFVVRGEPTVEVVRVKIGLSKQSGGKSMRVLNTSNGRVRSAFFADGKIELDDQGTLHIRQAVEAQSIDYAIEKYTQNADVVFSAPPADSEWMQKEFDEMPEYFRQKLDPYRNASDLQKLDAVRQLFSEHFMYDAAQKVRRGKDVSWMRFFDRKIGFQNRMHADCDVLDTYAFVAIRYLNLPVAFRLGFLNQDDPAFVTASEAHGDLVVRTSRGTLVFDPTMFVPRAPLGGTMPQGNAGQDASSPEAVAPLLNSSRHPSSYFRRSLLHRFDWDGLSRRVQKQLVGMGDSPRFLNRRIYPAPLSSRSPVYVLKFSSESERLRWMGRIDAGGVPEEVHPLSRKWQAKNYSVDQLAHFFETARQNNRSLSPEEQKLFRQLVNGGFIKQEEGVFVVKRDAVFLALVPRPRSNHRLFDRRFPAQRGEKHISQAA